MKSKPFICALAVLATLAAGCKQSTSATKADAADSNPPGTNTTSSVLSGAQQGITNAWTKTKEATAQGWEDVKDSIGATGDYTYDRKNEFVTQAQADLKTLDLKIQALTTRAAAASDPVKTDAQARLQNLHDERTALDKKLDDVKSATPDNWNDVKTAFVNSYSEAKNTLKQTGQWLNSKTNP